MIDWVKSTLGCSHRHQCLTFRLCHISLYDHHGSHISNLARVMSDDHRISARSVGVWVSCTPTHDQPYPSVNLIGTFPFDQGFVTRFNLIGFQNLCDMNKNSIGVDRNSVCIILLSKISIGCQYCFKLTVRSYNILSK